ncbi:MAG: caspase family protein, partial [Myxococcota bacterium]
MKLILWTLSITIGLAVGLTAGTDRARAQSAVQTMDPSANSHGYALVVGSNPGGQGQDTLRYAERDAERMAEVLRDLGGYPAQRIHLLTRPTPERLLAALDAMAAAMAADSSDQAMFFFYYSGHARASALSLGDRELPLTALRERIMALPAKLTVVVLDACQSGAFSRIKGAEPAADFSFNSVGRLEASGVAVMASSTASELS